MKKLFKKALSQLIVISLVLSMFAMCIGTASAATGKTLVAGFEHWGYVSTEYDKRASTNIMIDTYRKASGSKSMLIDGSDSASAFFAVGDGVEPSTMVKVEANKKYVLSFKYYIARPSTKNIIFGVCFAKTGSRWYSPLSNTNGSEYEVSPNASSDIWLNAAVLIDTTGITFDNNNVIYFSVGNINGAQLFIDDMYLEEVGSSSVAIIHNDFTKNTEPYYLGTNGTAVPYTAPEESDLELLGVYGDAALTTPVTNVNFGSGLTEIFIEYGYKCVTVDFESYYADHKMDYYKAYSGMDFDYELATFTNTTKTTKSYDFENYNFTDSARVRNVTPSTDFADKNQKSLKLAKGSQDGFFIVGNTNTDTGVFKVTPGKNYIMTFKYLVNGNLTSNLNLGVAFCKKGSRWYDPTTNADSFVIQKNTEQGVWKVGKIYLDTSVIGSTEAVCVYLNFGTVSGADVYIDNMSIVTSGDATTFVTSNKTSLHRKGESPYLENVILNPSSAKLFVGEYYTVKMWIKMDKYAQTNGAVSLLRNTSGYSAWTPASCTSSNLVGNAAEDYIDVMPITSLTDGAWHVLSCTFKATASYLVLQTPAYCSIYVDDVQFTHLGAAGTPSAEATGFTAYTQHVIDNPVYTGANSDANTFGFENYPYAFANKSFSTALGGASAGKKSLAFSSSAASDTTANYIKFNPVSDGKTYKITFDYKLSGDTANLNFATADGNNIGINTTVYKDEGNFAVLTDTNNEWASKTVYLTTDFAYTVTDDENVNSDENANITFGDTLYAIITKANAAATDLYLDNFSITAVNFLASDGVSVLTDSAANTAGSQALRFYFNYPSSNGTSASFDGKTVTVTERGVILANGNNTDGKYANGSYTVNALTLADVTKGNALVVKNTANLNSAWKFASGKTTYSFYLKGYNLNDENKTSARGYVKLSDGTNTYVVYSDIKNTSVKNTKYVVSMNNVSATYHKIGSNSLDGYKIVLPHIHSYLLTEAAENLQQYLASVGQTVTIGYDSASAATKEIIIGDTTRSETVSVSGTDNYKVKAVNNKLVIKGGSDLAVYTGVMDLIAKLKEYSKFSKGYAMSNNTEILSGSYVAGDSTYQLTFGDEFEGNAVDTNKWTSLYGFRSTSNPDATSWCGGKCYKVAPDESNFTFTSSITHTPCKSYVQENGVLNMTTGKFNATDYYGVNISTCGTTLFKYGVIEIRAKLAKNALTSFWFNGDTSSMITAFPDARRSSFTEWDLIETRGANDRAASNIHRWLTNDTSSFSHDATEGNCVDNNDVPFNTRGYGAGCANLSTVGLKSGDLQNGYHIFTFVWENNRARFCVDGKVYWTFDYTTCTNNSIFSLPVFMDFSSTMGAKGSWSTDALNTIDCSTTSIDYVRLYQINDIGSELINGIK